MLVSAIYAERALHVQKNPQIFFRRRSHGCIAAFSSCIMPTWPILDSLHQEPDVLVAEVHGFQGAWGEAGRELEQADPAQETRGSESRLLGPGDEPGQAYRPLTY